MKASDAAKQIISLLEEAERRGAGGPSPDLKEFLRELSISPGLKKPRKRKKINVSVRKSLSDTSGVGVSAKRLRGADMTKTIEELAQKLRSAFESDERFETVLSDPETQQLSKANVVTLYNRVFESPRPLSKSMTKPEVFNAIRRERINWVRGRS